MSRKETIRLLEQARKLFCGMGTRQTKLRLNKLVKSGDTIAAALRTALELEDANITAKKYHGGDIGGYTYDELKYVKKAELIDRLIDHCKTLDWTYGIHASQETSHIIYFEIPNGGQISYHFSPKSPKELPLYASQWDQEEGSALVKLERAISRVIGGELGLAAALAKPHEPYTKPVFVRELTEEERIRELEYHQAGLSGLTPGSNKHQRTLEAIARLTGAPMPPKPPKTEEQIKRQKHYEEQKERELQNSINDEIEYQWYRD